jgi:hypothetical protein
VDGGWRARPEVRELVGGADLTRADALGDGTLLALTTGAALERRPRADRWAPAELAPLGAAPLRFAAWRDGSGKLNALALVGEEGERVVLRGDAAGWRPLALPPDLAVVDFSLAPSGATAWVAGEQAGKPVTARFEVGSLAAGSP